MTLPIGNAEKRSMERYMNWLYENKFIDAP